MLDSVIGLALGQAFDYARGMLEPPVSTPDTVSGVVAVRVAAEVDAAAGLEQEAAALAMIVLVEQVKARLDAVAVSAWRALFAGYARETTGRLAPLVEAARAGARTAGSVPSPSALRAQAASAVRGGVVAEVMAATGLPEGECWRRMRLAIAPPERSEGLLSVLAAGAADLSRVARVCDELSDLEPDAAAVAAERVIRPNRDGSVASHALVGRRLRQEMARHRAGDPAGATRTALAAREASAQVFADGTGAFRVTGESGRVCAAMTRVDAMARRLRSSGACGGRTLDQLRSDLALDLLLYGDVRDTVTGPSDRVPGAVDPVAEAANPRGPSGAELGMPLGHGPVIDWGVVGQPPAAHVDVVVQLSTLLGCDDNPGELPGWGFVSGAQVRQIAHAAGSVWRRLVVDDATGEVVQVSAASYRPTTRMRDFVAARDRVCRGPGCQVSPVGADLDHDIPWPAGATTPGNLSVKHRRHHQLKTFGLWATQQDPDTATITWTTLAGRTYVTHAHDYLDGHRGSALSDVHCCDDVDDVGPPIRRRRDPRAVSGRHTGATESATARGEPTAVTSHRDDPPPF